MGRKERYRFQFSVCQSCLRTCYGDSFGLEPELDSSSYLYFTIRAQTGSGKKDAPCAVEGNGKGSETRGSTQPVIFTSVIHLSMIFLKSFIQLLCGRAVNQRLASKPE